MALAVPPQSLIQALQWAAWQGDAAEVARLLPALPATTTADLTALHLAMEWAAKNGHVHVVDKFVVVGGFKQPYTRALRKAADQGHVNVVRFLIPFSTPNRDAALALHDAARAGQLEMVALLMTFANDQDYILHALASAASTGQTAVVAQLISGLPPPALVRDSRALRLAAQNGHLEVVKLLLPVSNPEDLGNEGISALALAAAAGHEKVVHHLLSTVDPKAHGSQALARAAMNAQLNMVKLLAPISDLRDAWELLVSQRMNKLRPKGPGAPLLDFPKVWQGLDTLVPLVPLEWVQELFQPNPLAKILGALTSWVPGRKPPPTSPYLEACPNALARLRAADMESSLAAALPQQSPERAPNRRPRM